MRAVDLNADLGEGFGRWSLGDDEALLSVVTSANVACGFHAGDPSIMARVCDLAAERGVVIGAHVAYRDLVGFGRRSMEVAPETLRHDIIYQLAALDGFARRAGTRVRYLKPHGALYHRACADAGTADAVVAAVGDLDPGIALLGLPGSVLLERAAGAGIAGYAEGYADRAYGAGGGLLGRDHPGAVLDDPAAVAPRAVTMACSGTVVAADGTTVAVRVDSLCTHGDTPGALGVARAVRAALEAAGISVRAFATA